ncbi:SUKH-4 family immunity protein [Streptomyces sp. NPDC018610]|uniref:SUKH-4 family immunity protein n=1 Tax=Streptomyces sp. NPDC018610 TaxID=3365049 RepID=UPI003791507A
MSTTTCTATRATAPDARGPYGAYGLGDAYDPFDAEWDGDGLLGPCARETAPVPLDARPPAPSLHALRRFIAVAEELASLRARLASHAARRGPEATAGATRLLLTALERDAAGETPSYREAAAALIRPLSLAPQQATPAPAPRPRLAVDLPYRLLAREFGAARVVRFEDVDFPPALTHEPTRRFLRETGLPEDASPFGLDPDADTPLPTVAEHRAATPSPHALPARADRLIRLGRLTGDHSLVVDGATGEVWDWSEPEATLYPLAKDVSTLVSGLRLLHGERRTAAVGTETAPAPGEEPSTRAYDRLALTLLQALTAIDPPLTVPDPDHTEDADWRYWTELFGEEAAGTP